VRILLVEDSNTMAAVMEAHLVSFGHDVTRAENGKIAQEKFSAFPHDLVLMDIRMPVMDGFEATRQIRAFEAKLRWAWTPVIFLTATDTVETLVLAIESGGDDLMVKGLPVAALNAKMKAMERIANQRKGLLAAQQAAETARQQTAAALHDLREAQTQLIQAEKMASLGQLITNVAHEINSPIGAIKSSGVNIADALDAILTGMPALFQRLDAPALTLFLSLISHANSPGPAISTREERAMAKLATRELAEADIPDAGRIAGILVQLNVNSRIEQYLLLLRHREREEILKTALAIAVIISSTRSIGTAVDRVSKIIFALNSLSLIDHAGEMSDANLHDGLESVLTLYSNQIKQRTDLVRQYQAVPPLRCLSKELNQVWINLIHNALQAMPENGTLTIGLKRAGNYIVVSVGDTGCGIPENIRGQIFDAFFTTRPTGEGSGLGLDIVRRIVDKHKGRIDFQSTVGVGTTFSVYLPLEQAETVAPAPGIEALDAMFGVDAGSFVAPPINLPMEPPIPTSAASGSSPRGVSQAALQAMRLAFLTEAPRLLVAVRRGLDAGDAPAIALAAHSLKGSAGYFDAFKLKELCHQVEAAADATDLLLVGSQFSALALAVDAAVARAANDQQQAAC